jgi:hypothetical protein
MQVVPCCWVMGAPSSHVTAALCCIVYVIPDYLITKIHVSCNPFHCWVVRLEQAIQAAVGRVVFNTAAVSSTTRPFLPKPCKPD